MERIEILNGVMLTAVQSTKFKTGAISIQLLRPLCREEASANALLPNVLLRGTEHYPDMRSISAALEELYGAEVGGIVRKKGEVQSVGLFAEFLDDRFADGCAVTKAMIDLLADILLCPKYDANGFDREIIGQEKENLANSIRGQINGKRSYAAKCLVRTMFGDEAYGIDRLGELADVEKLDPFGLLAHYRSILETSRVEICYIGALAPQTVAELLRKALAAMPRGSILPVGTQVILRADEVREASEALDITQGKLCFGFRTGCSVLDDCWTAAAVFATVYGGGVTSKLFCNVREKQSICYYASASLEKFKGFMMVSSGIDFSQYESAKAAILREWEACRRGEISEEELNSAKIQMLSAYQSMEDSPSQLDEFYIAQAISGKMQSVSDLTEKIKAVSVRDVSEAAKRMTLDTIFFLRGMDK